VFFFQQAQHVHWGRELQASTNSIQTPKHPNLLEMSAREYIISNSNKKQVAQPKMKEITASVLTS